jgi:hypothetical protein
VELGVWAGNREIPMTGRLASDVWESGVMFVTTHVLSRVLIGQGLRRRPIAALAVGVGSHLVLDALPHWGCNSAAPGEPERFLKIAKRDGVLGLAAMGVAAFAVDRGARAATLGAMVGAVLLDLDKPLAHLFGVDPFPQVVTRIHRRVQNESPHRLPIEFAYGTVLATADLLVIAMSGRNSRPRGQWSSP